MTRRSRVFNCRRDARNSGLDAGIQTLRTAIPRIFGSPQNSALAAIITPSPTPAVSTATPFFSRPYFHIADVTVAAVAARELKYVGVCTASIRAAVCRTSRKYPGAASETAAQFCFILGYNPPPSPAQSIEQNERIPTRQTVCQAPPGFRR